MRELTVKALEAIADAIRGDSNHPVLVSPEVLMKFTKRMNEQVKRGRCKLQRKKWDELT